MDTIFKTKTSMALCAAAILAIGPLARAGALPKYPAPAVAGPAGFPGTFPTGFAPFDPPVANASPKAATPEIAEWTRIASAGDTMVLSGEQLSSFQGVSEGRDTLFRIYANGMEADALIQRLDGRQCALTLPGNLPPNTLYLLWPRNNQGFGRPVAIGQADAWWVGPDRVARGGTFSVYGRNLVLGSGSAHVYLVGYGWLDSASANPYKATFQLPANLASGTYEVWAHNGHGGKYGWSKPLSLVVENPYGWNGRVYDVTAYGANGGDGNPDDAAINGAIAAANADPGSTVYFPAGTYRFSSPIHFGGGKTVKGAGMGATILVPHDGFSASANVPSIRFGSRSRVEDLAMETRAYYSDSEDFVGLHNQTDIAFARVKVTGERNNGTARTLVDMQNASRISFNECAFVIARDVFVGDGSRHIRFTDSSFLGIRDCNQLVAIKNSRYFDLSGCFAGNFDETDESNGFGWCKGRWLTGTGSSPFCYVGESISSNIMPRRHPNGSYAPAYSPDQNSGEQIMFEGLVCRFRGKPVAVAADSVTFSGLAAHGQSRVVSVLSGRGMGQSREIAWMDTASGKVALVQPWTVMPDSSSVLAMGNPQHNTVVFGCELDGRPRAADGPAVGDPTASAGAQVAYGGGFDIVVDGNRFTELKTAIYNWAVADSEFSPDYDSTMPNHFNVFQNNTADRCYQAYVDQFYAANKVSGRPYIGTEPVLLGNVYRKNRATNIVGPAFNLPTDHAPGFIAMDVFDRNEVFSAAKGVAEGAGAENSVWIGNTFAGKGSGSGIALSGKTVLRGNSWSGFAKTYDGTLTGPVLELPQRVSTANAGGAITLYNGGTARLDWTASVSGSWLRLLATGGSIAGEGASGTLPYEVAGTPQVGDEAVVTVSGGGRTKQVTVVYGRVSDFVQVKTVSIVGPSEVKESSQTNYACMATLANGTTTQVEAQWSDDSSYAVVGSQGLLSASAVDTDQFIKLAAVFEGIKVEKTVAIRNVPPPVTGIVVTGPSEMKESSMAAFTCTASYADGTSGKVDAVWNDDSPYALISSAGLVRSGSVPSDQTMVISAEHAGFKAQMVVTIRNQLPPLAGIAIAGPSDVNESTLMNAYTCIAYYTDGASAPVEAVWNEDSPYALISSAGLMRVGAVPSDQTCTITAVHGGLTTTRTITIRNVDAVLSSLSIDGPSLVDEGGGGTYTCTANYADGSSRQVVPAWTCAAAAASISSAGVLQSGEVAADTSVVVTASYGGLSSGKTVVIRNAGGTVAKGLSRQVWLNLAGNTVGDLTGNAAYPYNPDISDTVTDFELPMNIGETYGSCLQGYIVPPVSGNYRFWISGDNAGELWLSGDDNPANVSVVASVPHWTFKREWTKYAEQQSGYVYLEAGRRYYVKALHKEGGGDDHLSVAWEGPGIGQAVVANDYLRPYAAGVQAAAAAALPQGDDQTVYPLTGFDGKWVRAEVWDDTEQAWALVDQAYEPEEIVLRNLVPGRWYWLSIKQSDFHEGGAWTEVHGGWIKHRLGTIDG